VRVRDTPASGTLGGAGDQAGDPGERGGGRELTTRPGVREAVVPLGLVGAEKVGWRGACRWRGTRGGVEACRRRGSRDGAASCQRRGIRGGAGPCRWRGRRVALGPEGSREDGVALGPADGEEIAMALGPAAAGKPRWRGGLPVSGRIGAR
jgi:hypothetical protein